jgi:hypothetical protein
MSSLGDDSSTVTVVGGRCPGRTRAVDGMENAGICLRDGAVLRQGRYSVVGVGARVGRQTNLARCAAG